MAEKGLPFGALFSMAALKYGMLCIGLFRLVQFTDVNEKLLYPFVDSLRHITQNMSKTQ